MLHQCCNGGCSCEFNIHHGTPFSILFPMSTKTTHEEDEDNIISSSTTTTTTTTVVDCTLSLGTPSTRHIDSTRQQYSNNIKPSFCSWDFFSHSTSKTSASTTTSCLGADPLLLARRCANCDTTSTPLWRNGPRGPKSLCNACGIRYKKEERRAAAATSKGTGMSMTFSGDDDKSSYLSWRLNVVPRDNRTSLFQYQ